MSFEARHIDNALRSAEQVEIQTSPNGLYGEMRDLFSPEKLEHGVQLEFFGDREGFVSFIETLQLDALVQGSTAFDIMNVMGRRRSATAYLGGAIAGLKNLQLVEVLEATQSVAWDVSKMQYSDLKTIAPDVDSAGAWIDLGQCDEHGDIDTSRLGVNLGLECRYLPGAVQDNEIYEYLPELLDRTRNFKDKTSKQLGNFATQLANRGIELSMPNRNYSIVIGPWVKGYVSHDPANRVGIKNGSLVSRVPEGYLE